jgi:AcrR family transcriptional regulator
MDPLCALGVGMAVHDRSRHRVDNLTAIGDSPITDSLLPREGLMPVNKVAHRRDAKIASIVEAAWGLARENGIQLVSLRDLAKEVGMQQPSLYAYFDSKNALYDAMFADGNRQLLKVLSAIDDQADPRATLKAYLGAFADFATADPARNSLLFRRLLPGFEPTSESYAVAQEALGRVVAVMNAAGVTDPGDIDCLVAMTAGLIEAQLSNEPAGDRWLRHLDRMTDLLVDDATERNHR